MRVLDQYLRPRYQPEILEDAGGDADTLRRLVRNHAPYDCMAGQPGYEGFNIPAIPWFRAAWGPAEAARQPDLRAMLENPRFADAAKRVFDVEIVRPQAIVLNLMGPMGAGGAHLDAPTFRTGDQHIPVWLMSLMGATGLFERWLVPVAAALNWAYDVPGDGAYEWWPEGPTQPRASLAAPFGNRAFIGDNDYMFHRVAPIGDPAKWPLGMQSFSTHARLEYRGDYACVVDTDGEVKVTYDAGEIRASLLWRGLTFADSDAERSYDEHLDDIDLATIERIFREDLEERSVEAPESSDVGTSPAWMAVLNEVYGFPQPDVS